MRKSRAILSGLPVDTTQQRVDPDRVTQPSPGPAINPPPHPADKHKHMDTRTVYALLAVAFVMATLYIMRRRVRQGKRVGKF